MWREPDQLKSWVKWISVCLSVVGIATILIAFTMPTNQKTSPNDRLELINATFKGADVDLPVKDIYGRNIRDAVGSNGFLQGLIGGSCTGCSNDIPAAILLGKSRRIVVIFPLKAQVIRKALPAEIAEENNLFVIADPKMNILNPRLYSQAPLYVTIDDHNSIESLVIVSPFDGLTEDDIQ